jgi:hypothetical protein
MSCRPGTRRTCQRWYRNIKESDTLKIYWAQYIGTSSNIFWTEYRMTFAYLTVIQECLNGRVFNCGCKFKVLSFIIVA